MLWSFQKFFYQHYAWWNNVVWHFFEQLQPISKKFINCNLQLSIKVENMSVFNFFCGNKMEY